MSLNGELTDLSLAELIEFFCNQRKTGRLAVSYPKAPAYFYLQSGTVVHASIGSLRGIEAVFYALTQSNAQFNFSTAYEAPAQTINQPWTSVVLEGLRRMDEGIEPRNPFSDPIEPEVQTVSARTPKPEIASPTVSEPPVSQSKPESIVAPVAPPPAVHATPAAPVQVEPPVIQSKAAEPVVKKEAVVKPKEEPMIEEPVSSISRPMVNDAFLASAQHASSFSSGRWKLVAVFAALVLIVAGIAVPWGWRVRGKAAKAAEQQTQPLNESAAQTQPSTAENSATTSATETPSDQSVDAANAAPAGTEAADAARREREARAREEAKLKAKAAETNAAAGTPNSSAQTAPSTSAAQSAGAGPKKATVTVTYDENGRVTGASGSDPTALRIARQKRFPAGKAGSATITIPIN